MNFLKDMLAKLRADNQSINIGGSIRIGSGNISGGSQKIVIDGIDVSGNNFNIPKDEKTVSKDFDLGAWSQLVHDMSGDVIIEKSDAHSCRVEAAEQVLAVLDLSVSGDKLVIDITGGFATALPIKIFLGTPQLKSVKVKSSGNLTAEGFSNVEEISLSGSGNISMSELNSETLSVSLAGSGEIELSGFAGKTELSLSGSGDLDAKYLQTTHLAVSLNGSGDIKCQADQYADLNLNGSGDIKFSGDASVDQKIRGSGEIDVKRKSPRPR